jgi:hypothetical protein
MAVTRAKLCVEIAPTDCRTSVEMVQPVSEPDIDVERRGALPSVAEGFQLKTWRGGPDAGKPKLSPIAKRLIARGLMRLDVSGHLPRLFFTEAGITALRAMMMDHRLADPKKFAHVRQELGIDPVSGDDMRRD